MYAASPIAASRDEDAGYLGFQYRGETVTAALLIGHLDGAHLLQHRRAGHSEYRAQRVAHLVVDATEGQVVDAVGLAGLGVDVVEAGDEALGYRDALEVAGNGSRRRVLVDLAQHALLAEVEDHGH